MILIINSISWLIICVYLLIYALVFGFDLAWCSWLTLFPSSGCPDFLQSISYNPKIVLYYSCTKLRGSDFIQKRFDQIMLSDIISVSYLCILVVTQQSVMFSFPLFCPPLPHGHLEYIWNLVFLLVLVAKKFTLKVAGCQRGSLNLELKWEPKPNCHHSSEGIESFVYINTN